MRTDAQIKQDILDELARQPNIDETQIGVVVKGGVVTLIGLVFSYATKIAVVKIIEKVAGVKAIAEGIKISYMSNLDKTDTEIANAAVNAMEWNISLPNDKVIVEVDNGWITLLGELESAYQKDAARRTVEYLPGVKGVTNNITLSKKTVQNQDIKGKKTKALKRSGEIETDLGIAAETAGNDVKLTGKAGSVSENNETEKADFNVPGVYMLKNKLKVIH